MFAGYLVGVMVVLLFWCGVWLYICGVVGVGLVLVVMISCVVVG